MSNNITQQSINRVIRSAVEITSDGNEQLTLLTCALVRACAMCGVQKDAAVQIFRQLFEDHDEAFKEVGLKNFHEAPRRLQ